MDKFKEAGDTCYIYPDEIDKANFQHDLAYGNYRDFAKRPSSDKVLRDKAFNIAGDPKYDRYQHGLAYLVYEIFIEKSAGSGTVTPIN